MSSAEATFKYVCILLNCCAFVLDLCIAAIDMKQQEDTLLTNTIHIILSLIVHGWAIKAALDKEAKGLLIVAFILCVYAALNLYRAISISKDFREVAKQDIDEAWRLNTLAQIERKLKCCGKQGPNDYEETEIPESCFSEGHGGEKTYMYYDSCYQKYYENRLKFFGGNDVYVRWSEFVLNFLCMASTSLMVYFYINEALFT